MKSIKSDITGRNIHSPFIYRLVANVIFAPYPFYSFKEIEKFANDKNDLFELQTLFRIINHFSFDEVIISGRKNVNLEKTCLLAKSDLHPHYFPNENFIEKHSENNTYKKLVIIDDIDKIGTEIKFPAQPEIWYIRFLKEEKASNFFEDLKMDEFVGITIRLNQVGIIIFNEIFKKQNYVIKHRV